MIVRRTVAMLSLALTGCLHSVVDGPPDAGSCDVTPPDLTPQDAGATSDGGPTVQAADGGWSIRDPAPYARAGHAAIYDSSNDRMVVFGGGGNDTWELPFAGPSAGVWRQLVAQGQPPPANESVSWASAVYDSVSQRMLVLLTGAPASDTAPALWQLSLNGAPTWARLETTGPNPGAELAKGRLTLDPNTRTLFAIGQESLQLGLWSLPLEGSPSWSRVADAPAGPPPAFIWQTELLFDGARHQLILFIAPFDFWGFSLDTNSWALLDPVNPYSHGDTNGYGRYGVSVALAGDRLVMLGGDLIDGVDTFSLVDQTWQVGVATDSFRRYGSSVVLDTQRNRAVSFGGRVGASDGRQTNAAWSLSLDDLAFGELMPETLAWDGCQRNIVFDPSRRAAIAFPNAGYCGTTVNQTFRHTTTPGDSWQPVNAGYAEVGSFAAAVYADAPGAIVSLGGDVPQGQTLASSSSASWELMLATGGPPLRWGHSVVYDPVGSRALVAGGSSVADLPDGGSATVFLDSVWSLDLAGAPSWSPLVTTGPAPAKRQAHAAVYDAQDAQMIVFGGWSELGAPLTDLWALSLGGQSPAWSELHPAGTAPDLSATSLGQPWSPLQAVYDDASQRLVLLVSSPLGVAVHALELGAAPRWHRFCATGAAPYRLDTTVALIGSALFASEGGGAFFFDLATPYCD